MPCSHVLIQFYFEPGDGFNVLFVYSSLALSCCSKRVLKFRESTKRLLVNWFLRKTYPSEAGAVDVG